MQTLDLDSSTRPGKWVKRGVQPEVPPCRKSLLVSLHELAAAIREESDPFRKATLEAQYAADTKALDALTCDPTSVSLRDTLTEISDCFSVIVDPPADLAEEIEMPESMTRVQWQQVHAKILKCNKAANGWLNKSRKFASERWGNDYVADCELQMSLALGDEPRAIPAKLDKPERDVAMAEQLGKTFARWTRIIDIERVTPDKARAMLVVLEPVADVVRKLRKVAQ